MDYVFFLATRVTSANGQGEIVEELPPAPWDWVVMAIVIATKTKVGLECIGNHHVL
jgi:4-diphosphocytidyl-2C-methyl-D-erythritol kinase